MVKSLTTKKRLLSLLTFIGGGTAIYWVGVVCLHMLRNLSPDQQTELISPDHSYRIVVTEQLAGFPGSVCIKQVYVLRARDRFDRNDEDNEIFAGACDGLIAINWNGRRVEGDIVLAEAVNDVRALTLKSHGANGHVQVTWSAH